MEALKRSRCSKGRNKKKGRMKRTKPGGDKTHGVSGAHVVLVVLAMRLPFHLYNGNRLN